MSGAAGKLRILVVTRSYPSPDNLYQYPFVHRRVLAYRSLGHHVAVFRPSANGERGAYVFQGVECTIGNKEAIDGLASRFRPHVLAIHGLGSAMWPALAHLAKAVPTAVWLHGSEIPGFLRRKSQLDGRPPEVVENLVSRCCEFWECFLQQQLRDPRLVFPSQTAVRYFEEDLPAQPYHPVVIPNPIDTELFRYRPKDAADRLNVLLLRPFDSRAYGNDLGIAAICALRRSPKFDEVRFKIIGEGPLFEETVAPVCGFTNVQIRRGFHTQPEIAAEHASSGIFLVPTRLDTQGVSRDEAMSSGLVPITNAIDPIPDFVDESCAGLAPPHDSDGLAERIAELAGDPRAYIQKSAAAAGQIRATRSSARIVPKDIDLLTGILDG